MQPLNQDNWDPPRLPNNWGGKSNLPEASRSGTSKYDPVATGFPSSSANTGAVAINSINMVIMSIDKFHLELKTTSLNLISSSLFHTC